jgi:hypothetical protein
MVAAYAFGVLGPAVAFAHADRASILHVLSETHDDGMLTLHFHDEDSDHHDQTAKPGSKMIHHCCGVVAQPGLEPPVAGAVFLPGAKITLLPPTETSRSGRGPIRLDRPPRLLLPV